MAEPQFSSANDVDPYPLQPKIIWILCLLCTPLAGAILFYVWKKGHPEAANLANRISWISWGLWIALGMAFKVLLA